MSVHYDSDRRRFVVRWREEGRQRSKRFRTEQETVDLDARVGGAGRPPVDASPRHVIPTRAAGDGVYAYSTGDGVRYRFVFRQSDGSLSRRRGFTTRSAAVTARRRLLESVDRGEIRVSREDFETFWNRLVAEKRAYMIPGSHLDLTTHGRKRLVPFSAQTSWGGLTATEFGSG